MGQDKHGAEVVVALLEWYLPEDLRHQALEIGSEIWMQATMGELDGIVSLTEEASRKVVKALRAAGVGIGMLERKGIVNSIHSELLHEASIRGLGDVKERPHLFKVPSVEF